MTFFYIVSILVLLELGLYLVVNLQRSKFQWLITTRDELPKFDQLALEKFHKTSFDPHLGWVRKPRSSGTEQGWEGPINFSIDATGSRNNRFNSAPAMIAAFGDSYTFCRQVEDDETWEAQVADAGEFGVLNYGVGNYGIDQALLRYESIELPSSVKVVVMGFVPETISRIQSYWKHYLEFGNTFAFKPRFTLEPGGQLRLVENRIRDLSDYARLPEYLSEIQQTDHFYRSKFRALQYRLPYTLSLLRHPIKQTSLLAALAIRGCARLLGITSEYSENQPFMQVMKANICDAQKLYRDTESRKLLAAICYRFKLAAEAKGHLPLLLIMPQLLDLKMSIDRENTSYQSFYSELEHQMDVLDMTSCFMETDFEDLYINDQYGGHLSVEGNRMVAERIMTWLAGKDAIHQP